MRRLFLAAVVLTVAVQVSAQRVSQDKGDLSALPAHVIVDSCSGCGGGGAGATIGAAVPATATAIAVKDNAGNLAYPLVDGSGNLLVAVTGAGSGGTSSVDGAAYVAGTTAGTPAMVARDDTSPTQLAEDKVGIPRGTAFRALHVNFRNASGTEIGVAGNAIVVDGSAVTQPISAAALPLPAGAATAAKQPALGTAGTSSADVITVQGRAAMTPLLVDGSGATQPVSGTVTANAGTNLNTSLLALEAGGNLAAIKAKTDNIPALGQALAAASTPVVLTAAQLTTLTPPAAITGFATEATLSTLNGKVTAVNTGAVTVSVFPDNEPFNVAQLAGTTTDTNSGNKSAGTLRVVLATDQPALTNKLLVTPDSVALPANQSVNVSQINGVTPLMGAGATGTGAQRVNDVASSATGAAPPASALYVGGLGSGATGGFLVGAPFCDSTVPISMTSATTTLIVTGVSGRHVYICHLDLVTAIANNVAVITGTGATCGTSTAGVFGGSTAANGWNFAANGGIALGSGIGMVGRTETTGDSICIITSAAGPLAGSIVYAIY